MRASVARWSWIVTVSSLSLALMTGCKSGFSVPGMDWMSWNKRKPASTALSGSTYPKKPSTGSLPNPSATTSGAQGLAGYPAAGSSTPYGGSAAGANSNYYTGQYITGGQSNSDPSARLAGASYRRGTQPGYGSAQPSYGSAQPSYGSTQPTYGSTAPYQSPYGAAVPKQNPYATADSRNSVYSDPSGGASAAGAGSWNADPYGRAADSYSAGNQVEPAGYGAQSSYPQTSAAGTPATSPYGAGGGYGSSSSASISDSTGLDRREGPYRPGSTGRNEGTIPGGSAYPSTAPSSAGRNSAYPSTGGGASPYATQNYPSATGQY